MTQRALQLISIQAKDALRVGVVNGIHPLAHPFGRAFAHRFDTVRRTLEGSTAVTADSCPTSYPVPVICSRWAVAHPLAQQPTPNLPERKDCKLPQ